jgi:hypothetical protein
MADKRDAYRPPSPHSAECPYCRTQIVGPSVEARIGGDDSNCRWRCPECGKEWMEFRYPTVIHRYYAE